MENCQICPLVEQQVAGDDDSVVLQTARWLAVIDRNQLYLGKGFVTLRQHKSALSELDGADWQELHQVISRMEQAEQQAFGADVCNWECLMNNAVKAGESPHVHWHLYPRYANEVVEFADEEFADPKWPRHLESGRHEVDDAVFAKILAALRRYL